jgi:hypothetical protein
MPNVIILKVIAPNMAMKAKIDFIERDRYKDKHREI